jgi:hypothetical protein
VAPLFVSGPVGGTTPLIKLSHYAVPDCLHTLKVYVQTAQRKFKLSLNLLFDRNIKPQLDGHLAKLPVRQTILMSPLLSQHSGRRQTALWWLPWLFNSIAEQRLPPRPNTGSRSAGLDLGTRGRQTQEPAEEMNCTMADCGGRGTGAGHGWRMLVRKGLYVGLNVDIIGGSVVRLCQKS